MLYIVFITEIVLTALIVTMCYLIIALVVIFVANKSQLYYKNWRIKKRDKKWQKEHEEFVQRQRRWELGLFVLIKRIVKGKKKY